MARRNMLLRGGFAGTRTRLAGTLLAGALLPCALLAGSPGAASVGPLHVPSPDWRDQVVYFAMLDRFDDGDPGNDDQGAGEYDPADGARYSGGDLRGLARRLDYLQGLGATTVWITPPVANQWWDPATRYGGYHGYWASDFSKVDAHLGTLADYRALARALHGRGMYLVQDVVVNHVGNWFRYPAPTADPAKGVVLLRDGRGATAPAQWPFSRNDPRDPAQRALGIYHWTPDIRDFADPVQERTWQLAGLDDLDTGNALVRRALRRSYGHWIRDAGVDGFRVDTAFYVPPEFFADFLHAADPRAPGIARVAAATGRDDFLAFGEGFAIDKPFDDAGARKIDGYMRTPGGLPSMINFPLYGTLGDVFARGHPPAELRYRIEDMLRTHADPWRMPTFVDNHDVDRFLAGGDEAGLKQALLAILTLPGIPVVYYGTEQGLRGQRDAMFAGGYGSGDRDRFDTGAPMYRWLQRAIALRRGHRVFSRGTPVVLAANPAGRGAIAWRTDHADEHALVVLNTGAQPALVDHLETGLPPGARLQPLFAIEGEAPPLVVGADGRLDLVLPPRSGYAWRMAGQAATPATIRTAPALQPLQPAPYRGDIAVAGTASPGARLRLVLDGDLGTARSVQADAQGRWQATLAADDVVDASIAHRLVAWDGVAASPSRTFRLVREWTVLAEAADPAGDDAGPRGDYSYPDDRGWRDVHPGDLLGARILGSGGALKVELRMRGIGHGWNPPNGFDHVAFTVFVELPGRDGGATAMPLQHADLPAGMRWHLRLRAHGWSNVAFASDGASRDDEGRTLADAPRIEVDRAAGTIAFTLSARALGHPRSLDGARIHVTTWDYDGGFRPLAPEAQAGAFGGGDGRRDPLWLDALGPVVLRAPPR